MAMKEVALKGLTHAASEDRLARRFEVMVQQVDRVDKLTNKYFVLDEPDQHYLSFHFS
jgi:DNA-directed RNA polymerase sigma subunit (sigma70/sigma32)